MRFCELKQKEIINICTCQSLGTPIDLDFDPKSGCIQALVAAAPGKLFGCFFSEKERIIPWPCIRQIGEEIILVELNEPREG
jgi:YlmC/YmxH family sporulation protein